MRAAAGSWRLLRIGLYVVRTTLLVGVVDFPSDDFVDTVFGDAVELVASLDSSGESPRIRAKSFCIYASTESSSAPDSLPAAVPPGWLCDELLCEVLLWDALLCDEGCELGLDRPEPKEFSELP